MHKSLLFLLNEAGITAVVILENIPPFNLIEYTNNK